MKGTTSVQDLYNKNKSIYVLFLWLRYTVGLITKSNFYCLDD